jgi:hypothetical protein
MGWRFRKSIGILPGVRVNISKSGLSTSLGERGASINIGRQGTRGSIGLPGTGLSYGRRLGIGGGRGWGWIAWGLPILALLFWAGSWAVKHMMAAHPAASAASTSAAASAASGDCACGGGNICTGPRGGHYCTAPDGHKRYKH